MEESEVKRYTAILEIWIYIAIGIYVIQKVLIENYVEEAKLNHVKERQNPFFMIMGKAAGYSPTTLFSNLVGERTTEIFKNFMSFLNPVFGIFTKIFATFQNQINSLRNVLSPIRDFFKSTAEIFYGQLQNFTIGILYSLHKIRDLTKRSLSGFNLLAHTLEHNANTISSIVNSKPVELVAKFANGVDWIAGKARRVGVCFSENTRIKMKNNSTLPIKVLRIDDKLFNGESIIALHQFKNDEYLYIYNDVLVTGSHLVYDNYEWKRVDETKKAKLTDIKPEYVYCISTASKKIKTNDVLFRDYSESNDKSTNFKINSLILEFLNGKALDNKAYGPEHLDHGFDENTHIVMDNGSLKEIKDVQIGDKLFENNVVIGKVEINPTMMHFYTNGNVTISSNMKILEGLNWINVENSKIYELVSKKPERCYNLVTENNEIVVQGNKKYKFRDYFEVTDKKVTKEIENLGKKILIL